MTRIRSGQVLKDALIAKCQLLIWKEGMTRRIPVNRAGIIHFFMWAVYCLDDRMETI